MTHDIKIEIIEATGAASGYRQSDPKLLQLPLTNGATTMFFIIVRVPHESNAKITDDVMVETFCHSDELPATTKGELCQSTEFYDEFLCFRDPVKVEGAKDFTVEVVCGSSSATRSYTML